MGITTGLWISIKWLYVPSLYNNTVSSGVSASIWLWGGEKLRHFWLGIKYLPFFKNIVLIYYMKNPISLIFEIILRINFRPSLCDFSWEIAIFLWHFNLEHQWNSRPPTGGGILESILYTGNQMIKSQNYPIWAGENGTSRRKTFIWASKIKAIFFFSSPPPKLMYMNYKQYKRFSKSFSFGTQYILFYFHNKYWIFTHSLNGHIFFSGKQI